MAEEKKVAAKNPAEKVEAPATEKAPVAKKAAKKTGKGNKKASRLLNNEPKLCFAKREFRQARLRKLQPKSWGRRTKSAEKSKMRTPVKCMRAQLEKSPAGAGKRKIQR